MGQERGMGLATLSSEASRARVMDVNKRVDCFADMKVRR